MYILQCCQSTLRLSRSRSPDTECLSSFKGPAPLQWQILKGESRTGVTLQTLHPKTFDGGHIIHQTPQPGVPLSNQLTYTQLEAIVSPLAAEMLLKFVRDRTYQLSPYHGNIDVAPAQQQSLAPKELVYAHKIGSMDKFVDLGTISIAKLLNVRRALGKVWSWALSKSSDGSYKTIKIIFDEDVYAVNPAAEVLPSGVRVNPHIEKGLPYISLRADEDIAKTAAPLIVNTIDGGALVIPSLQLAGGVMGRAAIVAWNGKLLDNVTNGHDRDGTFKFYGVPGSYLATSSGKA